MELGCIVEGDGEEDAVPVLLRRIIAEIDPTLYVRVHRPFRRPKGQLKRQDRLSAAVEQVARRMSIPRALLVLLDADDDCPAELGPRILAWAQSARADLPISVVVANREYESWFLAAADSLRGHRGFHASVSTPTDPESIRGAKEWLRARMPASHRYSPVAHQASFCAAMDLEQARRAPSFDKLCRDVRRLVDAIRSPDE